MANLQLKREILEVVDNQLRDNDPPETRQVYEQLLFLGCSSVEARERIGAVVLTEIYYILKDGKNFDEKAYVASLKELPRQYSEENRGEEAPQFAEEELGEEPPQYSEEALPFDEEQEEDTETAEESGDEATASAEWAAWSALADKGYEAVRTQDYARMCEYWFQAWDILKQILAGAEEKLSLETVIESQDYEYGIDGWLQDFEMELGNAQEHEKRIAFCQEVLDLFDWTYEDDSNYKAAIGEELYHTGRPEEGRRWFEEWLEKAPDRTNGLSVFSWCLEEQEGPESAYALIRDTVLNNSCHWDNEVLFYRARDLAKRLHREKDLARINRAIDAHKKAMRSPSVLRAAAAPKPVVKEQKIYPNDPCPCGSGKKYKKCCGRK